MGELVALRSTRLAGGFIGLVAVEEEEEELPGWCWAALATPAAALYSPLVVAHTVELPLVLLLLVPTVGTAAGVVTEVFPEAKGEVSRECASRQSVLMLNVRATPNPAEVSKILRLYMKIVIK